VFPVQVFFGPVEAQVLSVSFDQIIVLTPPASGAGLPNLNNTVDVRVHEINSGLDATLTGGFRFVTALQITAMDNSQQRVDEPFTPVTIHGQGFLSPEAVTLAGIPAKVISVSATELLVLPGTPFVSACTDISGPVRVTNIDSGDTATGPTFIYQVVITKPIITSVSPNSGSPGTVVTISGANLGNVTSVTFGGRAASIGAVSPTTIIVTVPDSGATAPACPAGTPAGTFLNVGAAVDVTVTSAFTGCTTTSSGAFQYKLPGTVAPTPTPTITVTPTSTLTPTSTPVATADLVLTKTASPNPVTSGSILTFTIGVTNNGPSAAANVVVTDPLPAGTTFCTSVQNPSCTACSTSQGSCTSPPGGTNGTVMASLGSIPAGGFAFVTITVTVTAPGCSSVMNTASVASSTSDPNFVNNHQTVTVTVSP